MTPAGGPRRTAAPLGSGTAGPLRGSETAPPGRPAAGDRPRQLGRFLIVGCSNFAVSFAVFTLVYELSPLPPIRIPGVATADAAVANVVGYAAGVLNSFAWNRTWTFRVTDRPRGRFRRFLVLNLACLLASSASLFVFTDVLGWPYPPVWLLTMTAVTGVNFALSRSWVFAPPAPQGSTSPDRSGSKPPPAGAHSTSTPASPPHSK